jgi:hypothetical protein
LERWFFSRSHAFFDAEFEERTDAVRGKGMHALETGGTAMPSMNTASTDRRSQFHTEVRAPIEAVVERVILFVFGVIEVLIALRFVLRLLGANAEAGFVQLIYGVSGIFMTPFNSIFGTQHVAGATFEWSALVAMAIYALIAWGVVMLIRAVNPRERSETVESVEKDNDVRVP